MGAGKAQAFVLTNVTGRHHQSLGAQEWGQSQISRSHEKNGLPKRADQDNRTVIVPYCHEADPACEHYGLLKLWSHRYCHPVDTTVKWQAQNCSCQHRDFLNRELTWSLWTCCHYGHMVNPALQVTRTSWTPKYCLTRGFLLSHGSY